jgi:hypothetical protein
MTKTDKQKIKDYICALEDDLTQQQIISDILSKFSPESEPEPELESVTKLKPEIKNLDPVGLFNFKWHENRFNFTNNEFKIYSGTEYPIKETWLFRGHAEQQLGAGNDI